MSYSDSDENSSPDLSAEQLCWEISSIHSSGDFATSGSIESFENPGLRVNNESLISLPISEKDTKSLITLSHQAPFGRGSETFVDESVRKTWQIDAKCVQFANKRWEQCLNRITQAAATELGVADPASVRAELHKMLIYEEGGKFEPHQDTEKVAGMFGTLVICLPSPHKGGDVVLQHQKKSMTFTTDENSAFDASYIAWYADVIHEVRPVKAGYRCALAYNLINTRQHHTYSAAAQSASIQHLVDVLDEWTGSGIQMYPLEHQYTPASLNLTSLKGKDYNRVAQVSQACSQHGQFHLLLANMEMHVTDYQSEDEEDRKWELYLTRIVDLAGCDLSVYSKRFVTRSRVLSIDHFNDRDPDVQRGGGYMGNQHCEIDEFYKDSVMVIVPSQQFTEFLLVDKAPHANFDKLLRQLHTRWSTNGFDSCTRQDIELVCRQVLEDHPVPKGQNNFFLGYIAVAAIWLKDVQLFTEAAGKATGCFNKIAYQGLGEYIDIQNPLVPKDRLAKILTQHGTIATKFNNINSYYRGFVSGNADRNNSVQQRYLLSWLDSIRCQVLGGSTPNEACCEDAKCLVDCIMAREVEPFHHFVLYQSIRQFAERVSQNMEFIIPLVIALAQNVDASSTTQQYLSNLLDHVIEPFSTQFDLGLYIHHSSESKSVGLIGSLLRRLGLGGSDRRTALINQIRTQAPGIGSKAVEDSFPAVLSGLLSAAEASSRDTQLCVQALLDVYMQSYVKHEPEQPKDWRRPAEVRDCYSSCRCCSQVNEFLNNDVPTYELSATYWDSFHLSNFPHLNKEEGQTKETTLLSKTRKHWEEEHRKWQDRVTAAIKTFGGLPQDALRECLGSQYGDYRELKILKEIHDHRGSDVSEATGSRRQPTSTVPQKRPRSGRVIE